MTTEAVLVSLKSLEVDPRQALDRLFELSRDLTFRQEAARQNAIPKLSALFKHYLAQRGTLGTGPDARPDALDPRVLLFKVLRVMRNLCGNVPETPRALHAALITTDTCHVLDDYTRASALSEADYQLLRVIVQLHSNMLVACAEVRGEVWQRCIHAQLYTRLTHIAHSPLHAHIAMCLHNCIASDTALRALLLQDTPATQLYMRLLHLALHEPHEVENVNTSVFYWSYLVFQKVVGNFDELMALARDPHWSPESDEHEPTSDQQLVLLKFLEASIEDLHDEHSSYQLTAVMKARLLTYLERRFEELEAKELVFTSRVKITDEAQFKRDLDALYLTARILSHLLEYATDDDKELLRAAGLLTTVIRMFKNSLDHEAELERVRRETGVNLKRERMAKTVIVENEFNFKVELMKLVCNMCFRHRASQDEVRALKGLPAILNHCSIDDNNPYIKEWAIVTLRNLCENNAENQEAIASLKTDGILASDELARLGLQAKLEANGKVTISKK